MSKHNEIRRRELIKLAAAIAKQFNISNPLDVQALEAQLLARYDGGERLTSVYAPGSRASAAKFRSDVRNVLIDFIATYGHLETMTKEKISIEDSMRESVEYYTDQIVNIVSQIANADRDSVRLVQGRDILKGEYSGLELAHGRVRPATQRISYKDVKHVDISYAVYPESDQNNSVLTDENGTTKSILRSGLNTNTWNLDIYTAVAPRFGININTIESISGSSLNMTKLNGVVVALTFAFGQIPRTVDELEIRFQQPVRIVGVVQDDAIVTDGSSYPYVTAQTRRDHVIPIPHISTTTLRVYVQIPQFTDRTTYRDILADQYTQDEIFHGVAFNSENTLDDLDRPDYYHYELGIYNAKFRLKESEFSEPAYFFTEKFQSNTGALQADETELVPFMYKGLADRQITATPVYYIDDEEVPIGTIQERTVNRTLEQMGDDPRTVMLPSIPYVTPAHMLEVSIVRQTLVFEPVEQVYQYEPLPEAVQFIQPAVPGDMPQFSTTDDQECFLLNKTVVFKNPIQLGEDEYVEIKYYVNINGIQYRFDFDHPDQWISGYMVKLYDHLQ